MSRYIRGIRPKLWWAIGLALWLVTLVGIRASVQATTNDVTVKVENAAVVPDVPRTTPAAQAAAKIDVSECTTCHANAGGDAFTQSKHGGLDQSCVNCHDKAAEHSKAQMDGKKDGPVPSIKKLSAKDANNICLTCHEKANQASFLSSMHARRDVACSSCHSVHSYKSEKAQLKTKLDSDTCFTCHKTERAKSMRASHHPVREDCATCHDPHGSNMERLLVAKLPFLCQRCHYSGHGLTGDNNNTLRGAAVAAPNPPGITTTQTVRSSRQMERSCKQCHIMIHGSNSASGWAFVR